jgi:hypothetical protein
MSNAAARGYRFRGQRLRDVEQDPAQPLPLRFLSRLDEALENT